jgi:hypothetical protein
VDLSFVSLVSIVFFVALACFPSRASAQIYESIGIRAQGMSGAFVAVADDATTTWWNPGGLASGGYFNGIVEFDRTQDPAGTRARAVAFTIPSLGLSYYRLALNGMRPADPTASPSASREDEGVLSEFGATVGQSVGPHLILGSTLKLVHALGETRADLDVGAMAALGRVRLGVAAKNLRTPEFSEGDTRFELSRQVRAGAAVKAGVIGLIRFLPLQNALPHWGAALVGAGLLTSFYGVAVGVQAGIGMNTIGESAVRQRKGRAWGCAAASTSTVAHAGPTIEMAGVLTQVTF